MLGKKCFLPKQIIFSNFLASGKDRIYLSWLFGVEKKRRCRRIDGNKIPSRDKTSSMWILPTKKGRGDEWGCGRKEGIPYFPPKTEVETAVRIKTYHFDLRAASSSNHFVFISTSIGGTTSLLFYFSLTRKEKKNLCTYFTQAVFVFHAEVVVLYIEFYPSKMFIKGYLADL